jgi:exosortase/archaeosortase
MDRKEKKVCNVNAYLKYGFWAMLLLFVLMLVVSFLGWQLPGMIVGILFVISVFFVFVTSIKAIVPDKSMAYIALGIAIVFILYLLLSATVSIVPSVIS